MRNLLFRHFKDWLLHKDLFFSLAPIPGTNYPWLFGMFQGIAHLEMAKSHVFLLIQISYPYIVWNNFPKFQGKRAVVFEICAKVCA